MSKGPVPYNRNKYINPSVYATFRTLSLTQPDIFWSNEAKRLDWIKTFSKIQNTSFEKNNIFIKWFEDGELNASQNCLDRHLSLRENKPAIIWESDDGTECRTLTFRDLHTQVCLFAGVLKNNGVKKGDIVTIYMPMIPEAAIAMLACARIGAVHSVVFAGFSPVSLSERIASSGSDIVITADEGLRAGKIIPLKKNVDIACQLSAEQHNFHVKKTIVFKRTGGEIPWNNAVDICWDKAMSDVCPVSAPESMNAESPLFILYTSGSTGKPKGLVHTTGGYLTYIASTFHYLFDCDEQDVYWCTADVGWITGHSYLLYAPLCCGVTTLMHEGLPGWPEPNRMASIIDKHRVSILYTAPTVIRAAMADSSNSLAGTSRNSLRKLGSVGEPIAPDTWNWYYYQFGNGQCPVIDTWWQTECGGIMVAPVVDGEELIPGAAATPFFGIDIQVMDDDGNILPPTRKGNLVVLNSWPGQARTVLNDHPRFEEIYFSRIKGAYFTGDGGFMDTNGHLWITGRVDDVLNVSGHRLGTAEIESALTSHPCITEAAIVGIPHAIKGEAICAYITLQKGHQPSEEFRQEIRELVRKKIGPIASPDIIHWTTHIPKTRSGKILRRVLKQIAQGFTDNLGDLSVMTDPDSITQVINELK